MLQEITGRARRAIDDYKMIDDGDKIAVGLSGGKDSISLLYALHTLQRYYPKKFDIMAITIDPGSETFKTDKLKKMCNELGIEYVIYDSHLSEIVFDIRQEKNPCSLCANLRRGMLSSVAVEHGCNKIALGHHLDDAIETLLMNEILNGNITTFAPKTHLTRCNLIMIRPLIYVYEKETRALAREMNFPVMGKCCPKDGFTKREYMKDLIKQLRHDIPKVRENLIGAIKRSDIPGWKLPDENNDSIVEK